MLLLTSASFPRYGLERFFKIASEVKADGVEILITENYDTQDPKYLHELEERFGIKIYAFTLPVQGAELLLDAVERVVSEFTATTLNLVSPETFSFRYKKWMTDVMPRLAERYALKINRRNMPFSAILGVVPARMEGSLFALKQSGSVALDLTALFRSKEDIMRAADSLGEKMNTVYLSNVHRGEGYMPLSLGILPLESFLTKLARERFSGDFILKISPDQLHAGDDERMVQTLRESKEFFEKHFRIE